MVVAVIAMRMVQVPIHQVIDVIAVRHRGVSAIRAVNVFFVVALAIVSNTPVRILLRYLDDVLVVVVFMGAVKVPVVKVAHVVTVLHGDVAAVRAVFVVVVFMDLMGHGFVLPASL